MAGHASPRRWFSFSLRTLFVVVTVAAILAGLFRTLPLPMMAITATLAITFGSFVLQVAMIWLLECGIGLLGKLRADRRPTPPATH